MNTDPISSLVAVFSYVLPLLPAQWAAGASVVGSFMVSLCALIAFFWKKPVVGSKLLPLYLVINTVGLNGKHAANATDTVVKTKNPTS